MRSRMRHLQGGFSLIEALIALLILAIGMLGVAQLQIKSLQGAHAAYLRSMASLATEDAVERLWFFTDTIASWEELCDPPANNAPHELAESAWQDQWKTFFPGFAGTIEPDTEACSFVINVVWQDNRFVLDGNGSGTVSSDGSSSGPRNVDDGPLMEDVSTLTYRAQLPAPASLLEGRS